MSQPRFYNPPRIGDVVYFYNAALPTAEPAYAHVVKYEAAGRVTIHVWSKPQRDPDLRRNVRHFKDPALKENLAAAEREGCWIRPDEHYALQADIAVSALHASGHTPLAIADKLGDEYTPDSVVKVLKRLNLTPNKGEAAA